jgi:sugar phosphate isomerase/epimerase
VRLAFSGISTVGASFAEDVAAAAAAGFDALGLWEFKLPPEDEANRALLRRHGLAVANCVPVVPSILQLRIPGMEGPPDPEERIEAICASVRRLAGYEPESVLVLTGPAGALDPATARRVVVEGLRRIAAAAREAGARLGLEPIHPRQHGEASFVHTVSGAVALLDGAGLDDVGVMADTYNLWEDSLDALRAHAGRVTGLHVADVPSQPGRTDRALPGENGTRTREVVALLRDAGWDGSLDVEIFSEPDRFWALPADEAARRAHAAAAALLA